MLGAEGRKTKQKRRMRYRDPAATRLRSVSFSKGLLLEVFKTINSAAAVEILDLNARGDVGGIGSSIRQFGFQPSDPAVSALLNDLFS